MGVKPIPEGYHTLTAVLAVEDASAAIDFYKQAFGAKERMRMDAPGGKIAHAELEIGDSLIMLSDPFPQSNVTPPNEAGTSTMSIFMYSEDVDAAIQQAVDAGATLTTPAEDMFWGDRFGTITDPYGHMWSISTHVEDIPPEVMEERAQAAMAEMMS
jgi:PhnB protein